MSEGLLTDAEIAAIAAAAKDAQQNEVYSGMEDEVLRLASDLQRCRWYLRRLVECYERDRAPGAWVLAEEVRAALEEQAAPPA